jgi:Bifunctional DNA primase/polymerase, N-terminal
MLSLEGRALPCFYVSVAKKVPFAGSHAYLDATADPAELGQLAARFRGPKLVAVATGAISGIDLIDIDPRNGGDKWFFENRDQLPKTRTHETRGGGWHLIFKHSPSLRNSNKLAPGVEFLSTGRWAVWWAAHACRVLCEGPVAALPGWLHERLLDGARVGSAPSQHKKECSLPMGAEIPREIPKPLYFEVLRLVPLSDKVTRRHQRWVISILSKVTPLREGRNDALFNAALNSRNLIPLVGRDVMERLLFGAAQCCGYVAKDGDRVAMATIRSGLGPLEEGILFSGDTQQGAG